MAPKRKGDGPSSEGIESAPMAPPIIQRRNSSQLPTPLMAAPTAPAAAPTSRPPEKSGDKCELARRVGEVRWVVQRIDVQVSVSAERYAGDSFWLIAR
jgi:hypothetical protein